MDSVQQKKMSQALTRYTNRLGLVSAIIASVGLALLVYQGFLLANQSMQKQVLSNEHKHKIELINTRLSVLEQILGQVLLQPGLIEAVLSADTDYLLDKEINLTQAIPDAVRVHIWKKNTAQVALDAIPPINFGMLDMVRKVEQGSSVDVEAFEFEGTWLVNIVRPIKKNDEVVGTVLVSFISDNLFKELTKKSEGNNDYLVLQKFPNNEPVIIYTTNDTFTASMEPFAALNINQTQMELRVIPGIDVGSIELVSIQFAIVVSILILILILFMTYLVSGRLQNTFIEDWQRFCSMYEPEKDIASTRFRLVFFKHIVAIIDNKIESIKAQQKNERSEKPAPTDAKKEKPSESRIKNAQAILATQKNEVVADAKSENDFEVTVEVPEELFKSYDIRGIVYKELTLDVVYMLGLSIGSEARARGLKRIVVAYDGRESSADFTTNLCRGIQDTGCDVLNIGMVPTPMLYFAAYQLETKAGVMVTGGSLPREYNGFKVFLDNKLLIGEELLKLRKRIQAHDLDSGAGVLDQADIIGSYVEAITGDIAIAQKLKVVVDAGNGVTGLIAPQLLEALDCEVVRLNCAVDGKFPNHLPDPSKPENLRSLILKVQEVKADLGIAFDGDGDRLQFIDNQGEMVPSDKILLILAKDVISRNPGTDIIFDVKSSRNLSKMISHYGGRPVLWKSGHPHIWQKLNDTKASLAGDFSGHYFFNERWFGFDDGLYAAARVLEILGLEGQNLSQMVDALPKSIATLELRLVLELSQDKEALMTNLTENAQFGDGNMTTIDGIRVDYADGWGLIRVSQTAHELMFRFEATTQEALERIQELFKREINAVNEQLKLPF